MMHDSSSVQYLFKELCSLEEEENKNKLRKYVG